MVAKRSVEVFSAGCPACQTVIDMVSRVACPSCEVSVVDMNEPEVARRAERLGIRCVPAVVIDGTVVECCSGRGPVEETLRDAGLGEPLA